MYCPVVVLRFTPAVFHVYVVPIRLNSVWLKTLNAWKRTRNATRSLIDTYLSIAASKFHHAGCLRIPTPVLPKVPTGARANAAVLKLL